MNTIICGKIVKFIRATPHTVSHSDNDSVVDEDQVSISYGGPPIIYASFIQ